MINAHFKLISKLTFILIIDQNCVIHLFQNLPLFPPPGTVPRLKHVLSASCLPSGETSLLNTEFHITHIYMLYAFDVILRAIKPFYYSEFHIGHFLMLYAHWCTSSQSIIQNYILPIFTCSMLLDVCLKPSCYTEFHTFPYLHDLCFRAIAHWRVMFFMPLSYQTSALYRIPYHPHLRAHWRMSCFSCLRAIKPVLYSEFFTFMTFCSPT